MSEAQHTIATHQKLFPVEIKTIAGESIETVDSRLLHSFLGIKEQHSAWIQRSLRRAKRRKNKDYIVLAPGQLNPSGGRPAQEYYLTLECCEHVGMMCDREKGTEIRDYFIAVKQAYFEKLKQEQASRVNDPWFKRLFRDEPTAFEAQFKGEIAAHLNALNEKTRQGKPKLPTDRGSERVAEIVPNRIRQGYVGTLGEDGYAELQRRANARSLNAAHRLIDKMSLDMMRGLMFGLAVAAQSEQHYQDMFEAATRNEQLCMALRWPQLTEGEEAI